MPILPLHTSLHLSTPPYHITHLSTHPYNPIPPFCHQIISLLILFFHFLGYISTLNITPPLHTFIPPHFTCSHLLHIAPPLHHQIISTLKLLFHFLAHTLPTTHHSASLHICTPLTILLHCSTTNLSPHSNFYSTSLPILPLHTLFHLSPHALTPPLHTSISPYSTSAPLHHKIVSTLILLFHFLAHTFPSTLSFHLSLHTPSPHHSTSPPPLSIPVYRTAAPGPLRPPPPPIAKGPQGSGTNTGSRHPCLASPPLTPNNQPLTLE